SAVLARATRGGLLRTCRGPAGRELRGPAGHSARRARRGATERPAPDPLLLYPSLPMRSPTNATTCDDPTAEPAGGHDGHGIRVAVLWHPNAARIGATAWAPWGRGATIDLGRIEPVFDDGAGLDDARISR